MRLNHMINSHLGEIDAVFFGEVVVELDMVCDGLCGSFGVILVLEVANDEVVRVPLFWYMVVIELVFGLQLGLEYAV